MRFALALEKSTARLCEQNCDVEYLISGRALIRARSIYVLKNTEDGSKNTEITLDILKLECFTDRVLHETFIVAVT